eukprot:COSAG04_NODE_14661_length_560_cov_0.796095_1_plen_86_part_10
MWSTPYSRLGHQGTGWGNSVSYESRAAVPRGERFKMLYDTDQADFGKYSSRQLLIATSEDGVHWIPYSLRAGHPLVSKSGFADTNT